MNRRILGISAFFHDAAACLVIDGKVAAAAQEERFSRIKHDASFPRRAIDYCLAEAGLGPEDLDYVAYYEKPMRRFERLLRTHLAFAPLGYRSFRMAIPLWLRQKLHVPREIARGLGGRHSGRPVFVDHHQSHAASAFFPSPFEEAAILTIDGVGEWTTACYGSGRGHRVELLREMRFPHSLGLLYSAFTYQAGFRVNSGEYKLMGLAPYGRPIYRDRILEEVLDLKEDGSFRMDMSLFRYCQGLTMTSPRFDRIFGGPPRKPESPVTRREMDLAASIQAVAEEVMLRMARRVHKDTGMRHLVLAGGVALNCVGNGRILREGPFERLWIQPAAGDAGGALGAALFLWHQLLENPRRPDRPDAQRASLLGPSWSDEQLRARLETLGARFDTCADDGELCLRTARLIEEQKVVGWFQGRMEFGPRALGARSILADARNPAMQSRLNRRIKFRESFRPFAPIVLQEHAADWFELEGESPYMLLVAPIHPARRLDLSPEGKAAEGLERLRHPRSRIPSVTHVDDTARVQTVDARRHPLLHRLLSVFRDRTGCPVLINTSFNVRNEPIVRTPEDAWRCFAMTRMDALVMGRHILLREDQPDLPGPEERREHRKRFPTD